MRKQYLCNLPAKTSLKTTTRLIRSTTALKETKICEDRGNLFISFETLGK